MRRLALLIFSLFLIAWPTQLLAQSSDLIEGEGSYAGIDLLFIVDHSGSMGGGRYGGSRNLYGETGNDPNGWRFSLPQEALAFLDAFGQPAELGNINMSVMAFGQDIEILLDWITIGRDRAGLPWRAANPDDDAQPSVLSNAQDALSAARFGFRNLQFTNTRYAFQQARNVFDKAPPASAGRRNYRAIIILTDGMPCEKSNQAFQSGGFISCPSPANNYSTLNASRAELEKIVREMTINHPQTGVYVIGMDVRNDFWERTADLWQAVACETAGADCNPVRYQAVNTDRGAGQALNRALLDIFNRAAPLSVLSIPINQDGSFELPPYLAFFRLSLYKDGAAPLGVEFFDPSGVNVGSDGRGLDTVIQTQVIAEPSPGTWRYQADDPGRIINVIPSANAIAARVSSGIEFGRLQQGVTTPLKMTITKANGEPLPTYPNYPLSVTAHIYDARDPSPERHRRITSLPLRPDPSAVGIAGFISNWNPGPDIEGKIEVRAEVSYTNPDGRVTNLIPEQHLEGSFDVMRTTVEWLGVVSERADRPITLGGRMTSGDGGAFPNLEGLVVGVRLSDFSGNPILPASADQWQVLPAEGLRGPDEIIGQFIPQVAGDFLLQQAIGVLKEDGSFQPIFSQPVSNPLTVRPIQRLRLLMTRPQGEAQMAQNISLIPPVFDFNVPVEVQVELRDQNDQPVSLAEVTGGQEALPQLLANGLPLELREISPGIYIAEDAPGTFAMGERTYTASVISGNEVLTGDAEWSETDREVSASVTRDPSPGMFVLGGLLLLAFLGVIGVFLAARQIKAMSKPYMKGTLVIRMDQTFGTDPVIVEIPLSRYENSRARLGSADGLPGNLTARVSNQRNENQLYLLELRLGREDLLQLPRKQLTENPSIFYHKDSSTSYTLWYVPEGSYFSPINPDDTLVSQDQLHP